jgi:arylsulfatase A-like enzyme
LSVRRSVAALAAVTVIAWPAVARAQPFTPSTPDIVLIVTDDQRAETLWAMPQTEEGVAAQGGRFSDAFVVNALCCPSRTSILTGDYSHTTGVYRQTPPFGRFEWFRDGSTLATWLDDAGYTTGLFGKYLDGYQHAALTGYVPPGWDRWVAFIHSAYYDYKLSVDGQIQTHGSAAVDYSTDLLAREAVDFIRSSDGSLFLYFAPAAPHAPAIPAAGDDGAFEDLAPWRPPAFDEADVSDKPRWVQSLPRLDAADRATIDAFRIDQYRSLLAVDRSVGAILDALKETGRLENTLILFTSDNGIAWGEHRWTKKEAAYDEVIRVPLLARWDAGGVAPGEQITAPALNIDLAPTIAEAAGVSTPPTDGRSLLPLLRGGSPSGWRTDFLVEHLAGTNPIPTFCAVRSKEWAYVRYGDGEEELYHLPSDPDELVNLAADPASATPLRALRARLDELCDPPPPGYEDPGQGPRVWTAVGLVLALFVLVALRTRRSVTKPAR